MLHQQGRVILDADLNEQADIAAYLDNTSRTDIIGYNGAPYHFKAPHMDGFEVFANPVVMGPPNNLSDFIVGPGRFYVDGLLVENDAAFGLTQQVNDADYQSNKDYVAYLDVWERLITPNEDESLREIALGGPDTATRVKTEWRIRLTEWDAGVPCTDLPGSWSPLAPRPVPTIQVTTSAGGAATDPCDVPVAGGYTGLENQLYRVEVHQSGALLKFKWSRDNGSLAARILDVDSSGTILTVSSLGHDSSRSLDTARFLEILTEDDVLAGRVGKIVTTVRNKGEDRIQVEDAGFSLAKPTATDRWIIRAWDGMSPVGAQTFELESGISVELKVTAADVRPGDFWQFAARALLNDVEGIKSPLEIRGEYHHYAPLAKLNKDVNGLWTRISDCRRLFQPLGEAIQFNYVGGDGQEAMPNEVIMRALEVSVFDGLWPVTGVAVSFTIDIVGAANGTQFLTVQGLTDVDGIARAIVQIGITDAQVTARLLDVAGQPIGNPIHFFLHLSKANNVQYEPGECQVLRDVNNTNTTVQYAIDRIRGLRRLSYFSGDGQVLLLNAVNRGPLPMPLQVKVSNICGHTTSSSVLFQTNDGLLIDDSGIGGAQPQKLVPVDPNTGIAHVFWQPAATPSFQSVVASLDAREDSEEPAFYVFHAQVEEEHISIVDGDGQVAEADRTTAIPLRVRVLAGGSIPVVGRVVNFKLDQVVGSLNPESATTDGAGYAWTRWTLGAKPENQSVTSFAEGITEKVVFNGSLATGGKRGFHIKRFEVSKRPTQNDDKVFIAELSAGFSFELTEEVDPRSVEGKPVGDVTLDIPAGSDDARVFPFAGSEDSGGAAAFLPCKIAGAWSSAGNLLVWKPNQNAINWLQSLQGEMAQQWTRGITGHIRLRSHAIWHQSEDGTQTYLEGLSLGFADKDSRTSIRYWEATGGAGSPFESWFQLVPSRAFTFDRYFAFTSDNALLGQTEGIGSMVLLIGTKTSSFLLEFSDKIDPQSAIARQTVQFTRASGPLTSQPRRQVVFNVSVEGNSIRVVPAEAVTSGNFLIELATGEGGIRNLAGEPIANAPGGNIVLPISVVVG
ncbi:MAG: DUF6519 domain-containing protein [Fimbriimonas sp.]